MSLPPPCRVQVPVEVSSDWVPASAGLPMSPQLHEVGHAGGGGGGGGGGGDVAAATWTPAKVAVPSVPLACEVTASPASSVDPGAKVEAEPGITVQVTPSGEVEAVKVFPARVTIRYTGTVPVGLASLTVVPPRAVRTCTFTPAPGVTTTA